MDIAIQQKEVKVSFNVDKTGFMCGQMNSKIEESYNELYK